jgi:hypothetical protein
VLRIVGFVAAPAAFPSRAPWFGSGAARQPYISVEVAPGDVAPKGTRAKRCETVNDGHMLRITMMARSEDNLMEVLPISGMGPRSSRAAVVAQSPIYAHLLRFCPNAVSSCALGPRRIRTSFCRLRGRRQNMARPHVNLVKLRL